MGMLDGDGKGVGNDSYVSFRHIWLYAKRKYDRTDLMDDLKILIGEETGMPFAAVSKTDVVKVLAQIVAPLILESPQAEHAFEDFIIRMYEDQKRIREGWDVMRAPHEDREFVELGWRPLVEGMLNIIMLTETFVDGRMKYNLGPPDSKALEKYGKVSD